MTVNGIGRRFEGKAAIVTAAAAGIGAATALRLAAEGADLYLADINLPGLEVTADAIRATHDVKITTAAFDASDAVSCRGLIADAVATLPRLDLLCNVAGIQKWFHFNEIGDADWDWMMRVNLSSVFQLSQAAMPHLEKTRGNIVNISSAAGLTGIAYNAPYCSAKAAVIGLTKSIAVEYAARGIRVNAIAPGGVKAGQAQNPIPAGVDMSLIMRLFPKTGDSCEPGEIAAAVAYLGSEEARFITGTVLTIDGGQLAG